MGHKTRHLQRGLQKSSKVELHMEEASPPYIAPQLQSKAEINHQHHQYQQRHQIHKRSASPRGGDAQTSLNPGQVVLRLLCHVNTAGGVIGNSGGIIKQLANQTGSKIRFEEPLPNCHERVINVIGDATIDKRIPINSEDYGSENENFKVEVSRAQEGLMRVFERVLEVEGNGNGVIGCRLLAGSGQIGAVMGKGGKIVDAIRRQSGAKIRVLKKDQIPACATPEEELIQIMGSVIAVKKALIAVSRRLQDRMPGERLNMSSHGALNDVQPDFVPKNSTTPSCFPGNAGDHTSTGNTLSADVDRILSLDEGGNQQKVVFRLLCSSDAAGGIIGKSATVVKSLEKETGASIKFSSPVAGLKERVATISSLESPDPLNSSAQIATVRVFARSIEVGINQGLIPALSKDEITARILIAPKEINFLVDDGGKVASDISAASGVEIQLLGANLVPDCASDNDKVVQIIGDYENVKSALFQVTGRLRDKLFSSMLSEGSGSRQYSYSAVPDGSPYGRGMTDSPQPDRLSNLTSVDHVNHLGFAHKVDDPHSPGLLGKQLKDTGKNTTLEDNARELKASRGGSEHQSGTADSLIMRTVEVLVPKKIFGSVYGENGNNLARLKEISGAAVILRDPSPGEPCGKVIISGTPERIQIAQSLLQAFILI